VLAASADGCCTGGIGVTGVNSFFEHEKNNRARDDKSIADLMIKFEAI
jgi:hypothetical protein